MTEEDFEAVEEALSQISKTYNLDAEIKIKEECAIYKWDSNDKTRRISLRPENDYLEVDCYELCAHGVRSLKNGRAPTGEHKLYNVLKKEYMQDIVENSSL